MIKSITKRDMIRALKNIPPDGSITITVDDRDYRTAKKQSAPMGTVLLGIPGDYSSDKTGICFLTSPLYDNTGAEEDETE